MFSHGLARVRKQRFVLPCMRRGARRWGLWTEKATGEQLRRDHPFLRESQVEEFHQVLRYSKGIRRQSSFHTYVIIYLKFLWQNHVIIVMAVMASSLNHQTSWQDFKKPRYFSNLKGALRKILNFLTTQIGIEKQQFLSCRLSCRRSKKHMGNVQSEKLGKWWVHGINGDFSWDWEFDAQVHGRLDHPFLFDRSHHSS